MKNILVIFCMICGNLIFYSQTLLAKEETRPIIPCSPPMFRVFDFWVGDWKVYHRESGELAGFDRVSRTLNGCAIQQAWVSLDDYFSSPLVPFRMNGKSLTAFDGQQWVQFWVDNQAGSQILKGKLEGDMMQLMSETPIMGYLYKLSWQKQKDGTVSHMARRKKIEEENWHILFDFIYQRNSSNIPLDEENQGDE